jgi:glycerol-3-phosphate O-acyltransferase
MLIRGAGVGEERGLDYQETSGMVQGVFSWTPGLLSSILVSVLSRFTRPLAHGSYLGRPLSGEPHRASWVIASPLTVFVLPEKGRRHRLVLAARLRTTGPINMIRRPPAGGRNIAFARRAREIRLGKRGEAPGSAIEKLEGLLHGLAEVASKRDRPAGAAREIDLEALVAIQRASDFPLTLVPLLRAYHQLTPDAPASTIAARAYRLSPLHLFRKATSWMRTLRTGRVKNCRPIALAEWLDEHPDDDYRRQAEALRMRLMGDIESERRACTGPPLAPRWEVRNRVLADPLLTSYMQEYSLERGVTREEVLEEARGFLTEIASDYRVGVARYFARVVDFFFDKFLDGLEVDPEGIRFLAECDSRSRIVLACSHKSYVDPLLIGYTLFRSGMVPPQQAAGLNLNFWPVGWLLRHSGAFYLRRTFAGETLYREVFCAYLRYLLAENYTSVVYIEGTRSRDGKLQSPKTGYLKILAESMNMGVCPDITLVPVYLGYDKVPEESAHVREMAGGRKISESVKGFARIYRSFNTRLGRAYVKFGTPVSMKALLREHGLEGTATVVADGINKVTPVTPRSLAAAVLLASGDDRVPLPEFERLADRFLQFSERRRLPVTPDADPEGIRAAVEWFAMEGHVSPGVVDGVKGFEVAQSGRRYLEYNKNMMISHFLGAAISAVAWVSVPEGDAGSNGVREEAAAFLKMLLAHEFVFSPTRADEAWKLDHQVYAEVLCPMLASYLEAYLVACAALGSLETEEPVPIDDFVDACFEEGERMLEGGGIHRVESLSRVAFKNAARIYHDMGLALLSTTYTEEGRESKALTRGERYNDRGLVEERIRDLARGVAQAEDRDGFQP